MVALFDLEIACQLITLVLTDIYHSLNRQAGSLSNRRCDLDRMLHGFQRAKNLRQAVLFREKYA